jgi:hypothetical protein
VKLRVTISVVAVVLALGHLLRPDVTVDVPTLILLVIALLPWTAPLLKSVELPGGWKFEMRALERAGARAESAGLLTDQPPGRPSREYSFVLVAREDPRLALAGLRIELEQQLLRLAQARGIDLERASVGTLIRALSERDLLNPDEQAVLQDMVRLLNAAVHGGPVDRRAADWAIDVGPRLLGELERRAN